MSIRWTEDEARKHGFVKDNDGNWHASLPHQDSRQMSEPESSVRVRAEGKNRSQTENGRCRKASVEQFRIIVTAHCRDHTDPDNLCPKWFIDQIVEAGIIPDDSSRYIREVVKRVNKIESWEPEFTEIEIWKL